MITIPNISGAVYGVVGLGKSGLATVASLLGLLAFVGAIIWLLERRHNTQFPRAVIPGIGAGLFAPRERKA